MSDNNKWNSTTRSDMEVLSAFVTEVQKRQPEATQIKKKAHEPKEIPVSLKPTDIDPLGNRVSAAGEISDTQYLSQIISGVERQTSGQKTQEEIDAIVREVLARMAADEQAKKDGTAVAVTQTQQVSEEVKEPVRKPDIIDVEAVEKDEEELPKKAKKKAKSGKGYYFGIGFFSFLNVAALVCFFVAYGPFNYLRDMFVTTAMRTMTHKYLANVLYSTETIQEILSANVTIEPDEVMDENAIHMNGITEEQTVFSSVYEEQVLKRDPGTLYKVQRLDEHGYKGYITFIYDPTHIDLAVTRYLGTIGEYVTKMAKLNNAHVAINGGGFLDYGGCGTGGQPTGYVIKHGKVVWTRNRGSAWGGGTIGFNQEGVLILTKKTGKDAHS
ncbi:MAG: hypothetical protein HUJ58_08675, partial [Erysipelotrichaceae bacterium]|nr:hypothetical protein [Erysipelotrichaceae bacterium]